ncbi:MULTISPECIES: hypothetical protein [Falsihalocynthiibacter]
MGYISGEGDLEIIFALERAALVELVADRGMTGGKLRPTASIHG